MCHMKFYFDSTKVFWHDFLSLIRTICSEMQCFSILYFFVLLTLWPWKCCLEGTSGVT